MPFTNLKWSHNPILTKPHPNCRRRRHRPGGKAKPNGISFDKPHIAVTATRIDVSASITGGK